MRRDTYPKKLTKMYDVCTIGSLECESAAHRNRLTSMRLLLFVNELFRLSSARRPLFVDAAEMVQAGTDV